MQLKKIRIVQLLFINTFHQKYQFAINQMSIIETEKKSAIQLENVHLLKHGTIDIFAFDVRNHFVSSTYSVFRYVFNNQKLTF